MSPRIPALLITAVILSTSCGGTEPTTSTTSDPAQSTITTQGDPSTTTSTDTPLTASPAESTTTTPPTDVGDLLVVGDWGSGTMPQGAVAGAMSRYAEDREIAAILTTGDNFYSDDAEFLMEPFGWVEDGGIPFWVAWGNHDIETDARIDAMNRVFDDPSPWTVHEWGAVDIVILDSTQPENEEQLGFFETTLAGTDDPTIVVFHHPRYSCGAHGDTPGMDAWVDTFDDDVFVVLNGHEHNYQRFEEDRITYVVTGGGGAALTGLAECGDAHPGRIAGESVHHFMAIQQDEDIAVTVYDVNGDVLDEFSVEIP